MFKARGILLCLLLCGLAWAAVAAEDAPEQKAVQRGVKYLRSLQKPDGSWPHPHKVGMTALAGLTLLECGAKADDLAVQKAAKFVRQEGIQLNHTYSLAVTLIFLDKFGQERDVRLMQSLGARLLAGQNLYGGWGALCPGPTKEEAKRLKKLAKEEPVEGAREPGPRVLPEELQQELETLQKQAKSLMKPTDLGDTTNTTWATLGLEVAGRYGFVVSQALQQVELRFRQSQYPDGGWDATSASRGLLNSDNKVAPVQVSKQQLVMFEEFKKNTVQIPTDFIVFQNIEKFGLAPFFSPTLTRQWQSGVKDVVAVLYGWTKTDAYFVYNRMTPNDFYPPALYYFFQARISYGTRTDRWGRTSVFPRELYQWSLGYVLPPSILTANPPPPFQPMWPPVMTPKLKQFLLQAGYTQWVAAEFGITRQYVGVDFWERDVTVGALKGQSPPGLRFPQEAPQVDPLRVGDPGTAPRPGFSNVPVGSTPPTTSDVLVALAICRTSYSDPLPLPGMTPEASTLLRKTSLDNGLLALARNIGFPAGPKQRFLIPKLSQQDNTYYFLWSLNQLGNAYGLTIIGRKDWRSWGTGLLLANQKADGSWQGAFSAGGADTCHALLFLQKTNWVPEVSARLKGEISDPTGLQPQEKDRFGEKQAAWLAQTLAQQKPGQQDALLKRVRAASGDVPVYALALAIPQVEGKLQSKVRQALVARLTKAKGLELREFLASDNVEICRAACAACQAQKARQHIPYLITLLQDKDREVAAAALKSLKALSGQDFGPALGATAAERAEAIRAWQRWWEKEVLRESANAEEHVSG